MARKYSVKARSFRWPLQVFFNILDLAAINAWILYKECTRSKISRKEFIFCLAEELTEENKDNICQRSDASFLAPSTSEVRKSCQVDYCKKIEVIIIVYIAKRSYAENAQTIFSIFAKNVLNRYDYCTVNVIVIFLVIILKKDFLFINNLFKCEA